MFSASVDGCLPTNLFYTPLCAQLSCFTMNSCAKVTSPVYRSIDKHKFNKTECTNRYIYYYHWSCWPKEGCISLTSWGERSPSGQGELNRHHDLHSCNT